MGLGQGISHKVSRQTPTFVEATGEKLVGLKYNTRVKVKVTRVRVGSRNAALSKMECFVIIVNGFQPSTVITKHSILDVVAALDLPLRVKVKVQYPIIYNEYFTKIRIKRLDFKLRLFLSDAKPALSISFKIKTKLFSKKYI